MGNYINVSQLQCPIRVLLVTGGDRLVISLKMTTNIYKTQFESQQYIRQYYSNVDREEQFFLTQLHELFSSFQSSSSPLSRPRVVLEIGSGPLVSGLVSASSWADLLIFSDLLEDNLRQIKLSLKQLSEASDANDAIFELESIKCIAHLEKIDVLKVQERMDQTPKIIAKCNLFSLEIITPRLLLPNSPSVIIIKLCLEFALDHVSQLTPVLTRVSNILSSGGKLVIMGALGKFELNIFV